MLRCGVETHLEWHDIGHGAILCTHHTQVDWDSLENYINYSIRHERYGIHFALYKDIDRGHKAR